MEEGRSSKMVIVEVLRFLWCMEFWRMAFLWTVSLIVSYMHLFFHNIFALKPALFHHSSPRTLGTNTPLCIVTGATSGLGKAAAYALSTKGFFVVLAARSPESLAKTVEEITGRNKDALLKAFEVDLSSFQSILNFTNSLEKWLVNSGMHCSVQLLINNAGILATSPRVTADGFDQVMATNYIGAFCLTKLLLPLLRNSPVGSRVVNVTSFTHRSVLDLQVDKELVSGKCFSRSKQYPYALVYSYSKLCMLLFTYELHRQFCLLDDSCQVSVMAADPGAVETNIMREIPSCLSSLAFLVLKLLGLLQSPEQGVGSILDAALASSEISGAYYFGGKGRTLKSSAISQDKRVAEQIWKASSDIFLELKLASTQNQTHE